MANEGMNLKFNVNLSPEAEAYFRKFPDKLKKARKECVERAGMIWSDETKEITTQENHIDTGLYVNSIGYSTGTPSDPKWDLSETNKGTKLTVGVGSRVDYAIHLEKRYNLMARGLDRSKDRIRANMWRAVKRNLEL